MPRIFVTYDVNETINIHSDQRSEPISFYTPFRSLIWRCQFLSKVVRSPMCHSASANRFARGH